MQWQFQWWPVVIILRFYEERNIIFHDYSQYLITSSSEDHYRCLAYTISSIEPYSKTARAWGSTGSRSAKDQCREASDRYFRGILDRPNIYSKAAYQSMAAHDDGRLPTHSISIFSREFHLWKDEFVQKWWAARKDITRGRTWMHERHRCTFAEHYLPRLFHRGMIPRYP